MNLQNVKRVEYLEFPADSRFGGKPFVVNFIMTRYEYGGYFKTYLNKNFILNTTQVNEYARFQYKRMTYDLTGLGFFSNAYVIMGIRPLKRSGFLSLMGL